MNDKIFEQMTFKEITIELLLINIITVSQAIDLRIEFKNNILQLINKN